MIALGVLVFASPVVYLILNNEYQVLYTSYEESLPTLVRYFGGHFGYSGWLVLVAGFSAWSLAPDFRHAGVRRISLFGGLSLAIWAAFPKETGIPFTTHFLLLLALGQALLFWSCQLYLEGRQRIFCQAVLISVLVVNFLSQLTVLGAFDYPLRSLFAEALLPLVRDDYAEFTHLLDTLRTTDRQGWMIYVVSSSEVLNQDLLRQAESQIYGPENVALAVFPSPDIDSRDTYPLEGLLQAGIVLVANPFQSELGTDEQEVVKVALDAFNENWEIAGDFELLPRRFNLGEGVVVSLYQRLRPTSLETALLTLRRFQQQIHPKPGNQLDWILLDSTGTGWINKNADQTVDLGFGGNGAASYIYFGSLPERIELAAGVHILMDQSSSCTVPSMRLAGLDIHGSEINHTETDLPGRDQSQVSLTLDRENAAYLRLDLSGQAKNPGSALCPVQILHLNISGP
jgi:hypothetical protein